jgi:hypothetical protein
VVLEGMLDANGTVIGPGAYAHFPARQPMWHQAAGDSSCLFVLIFHVPFDVEVLADASNPHPANDTMWNLPAPLGTLWVVEEIPMGA